MEQAAKPSDQKKRLAQVAEALIFAADASLEARQIAAVYAEVTGAEPPDDKAVVGAVEQLNAQYRETGRALRIERWAGGFRMATAPPMAPYLKAFFEGEKQNRLSRALMETVAIVAYRQPVTRPEVEFVRGVSADYALRKLLETGLVDVVGRSDSVGRPLLYGTTGRFLEQFGLDDLGNLPNLREIEELLDDPEFQREKARQLLVEGLDLEDEEEAVASSNGEDVRDA